MISITIQGETFEEIIGKLDAIKPPIKRQKVAVGESSPIHPKVTQKSDDQISLKEVQAALHLVKLQCGEDYVQIILDRIPCGRISDLKPSEFSRTVRLCKHYLGDQSKL